MYIQGLIPLNSTELTETVPTVVSSVSLQTLLSNPPLVAAGVLQPCLPNY